jgi:hypothetical protein
MENWVITDCGKIIDMDGLNGLSWRNLIKNSKVRNRISTFKIPQNKFNFKTPTLESVDNAIAEQYPNLMLETGTYANWYILNHIDYTPDRIKINEESLKISIPNSAWKDLKVNYKLLESINYNKMEKELQYYNKSNSVKPLNNDLYLVAFYDIWCVFYRLKKINGTIKLSSCLMRNNYSYCKNIVSMTYAKNILKKEFIFSGVIGKENNSLIRANLKLSKGWLETGSLISINRSQMMKVSNKKIA